MDLWNQFIGHAYTARSQNINAEELINLFVDTQQSATGSKKATFYGTPGFISLVVVGDTQCRGLFSQDGRHFGVYGQHVYEFTISGTPPAYVVTAVSRGTVALDTPSTPVYFASDGQGGNQIAISSAGSLYGFNLNTNTLSSAIVLPLTNPCGQVVFLNGRFLLVEQNSLAVWFSAFEDVATWPGLNFFKRSNASDNVVGMAVLHDQVRVFGSKTSEIFYNVGEAVYPFLPYQGSIIQHGALNASSIGVIGDQVFFIEKAEFDVAKAMVWGNGDAQAVSTPAVDFAWSQYSTLSDGEILCYEQEAHQFVCWTFPTADVTWCYDTTEKGWHKRLRYDSTLDVFHRWGARGIMSPGSQLMCMGDYSSGDLYQVTLDRFDDNCRLIKRLRRAPYPADNNDFMFIHQIEMGVQSGVGLPVPPGTTPNNIQGQITLRVSRDSANTFTAPRTAVLGVAGATGQRCVWGPSGRSRADRLVIEVSSTAAVRQVWGPGLWLRSVEGRGSI